MSEGAQGASGRPVLAVLGLAWVVRGPAGSPCSLRRTLVTLHCVFTLASLFLASLFACQQHRENMNVETAGLCPPDPRLQNLVQKSLMR